MFPRVKRLCMCYLLASWRLREILYYFLQYVVLAFFFNSFVFKDNHPLLKSTTARAPFASQRQPRQSRPRYRPYARRAGGARGVGSMCPCLEKIMGPSLDR
jgi:hypothetical protein